MSRKNNSSVSCSMCNHFSSVYKELIDAIQCIDVLSVSHILNCSYDLTTAKQSDVQTLAHRAFRDHGSREPQIIQILELLFDRGLSINAKDSKEHTVLHLAIKNRRTQIIDFLLERQADLDVRDGLGNSLMHYTIRSELDKSTECIYSSGPPGKFRSSQKESADFILYMVLKGLDVDCQNKNGDTAVHLAATYNLLHALPILLSHTKNVKICNDQGMTAFQVFANNVGYNKKKIHRDSRLDYIATMFDRQDPYKVKSISPSFYSAELIDEIFLQFLSKGFSANFVDRSGSTPVHYALTLNRPQIVNSMLKEFINVHARDEDGNTVLHLVIDHLCRDNCNFVEEYKEIARDFWSKGADIYALNKHGLSPLNVAMKSEKFFLLTMFLQYEALFTRQQRRDTNLLLNFYSMKSMGSDREASHDQDLLFATETEKWESSNQVVFDQLIKHGWEVNARDSHRTTLLHVAAQLMDNGEDLVDKLIDRGAHIDVVDDDGCMPLHIAIFNENFQATKALLMFGADINESTHLLNVEDLIKCNPGSLYFTHIVPGVIRTPRRSNNDKSVSSLIFEHLITLKVAGLPVDRKLRCILTPEREDYTWIYQQCSREIKSLKAYKITNVMSLYNLLYSKRNSTLSPEVNENLKMLISCPGEVEGMFPLYHVLISGFYHAGITRGEILEPAKDAFTKFANIRLPELCLHAIFSYLNNFSLRRLIEAAKDIE